MIGISRTHTMPRPCTPLSKAPSAHRSSWRRRESSTVRSWVLVVGAMAAILGAPLVAHAQATAPTPVPNLGGYDSETRQSMELACVTKKSDGPVAYGACLDQQIASLKASPGIPSLRAYDSDTRQLMELACASKASDGPVAYGACLYRQIASMQTASHRTKPRATANHASGAKATASSPSKPRGITLHDADVVVLVVLLIVVLIYLTPLLWVLLSSRSRGGSKFGWFVVVVCFSWLGLAVFLIVTQKNREPEDA